MDENKKKVRRVSFASEAPEQNVYEKEVTINSFTTDDITAELTFDQTKVGKSFYEVEEKENSSVMSNNTAVFEELADTQYIRTIVPPTQTPKININELLMEQGIRFLDDIVVSSTRRETLSKSKKEVDPSHVIYYKHFLTHRIKFFEDFSEDLKLELNKLSDNLKQVEQNFNMSNTLLEKEDKSKLRSLKSDCRNRANVSWYELRAKKELEFNDLIIKTKNDLINEFNQKENMLAQLKKQNEEELENIKNIDEKLSQCNNHADINMENLEKIKQKTVDHEKLLENYLEEYEKLKIDVNNKKASEAAKENNYENLKNEILELEKQFKTVNVNENDLNEVKNEYEKLTAILGIEIIKFKNNILNFKFLNYEIEYNIITNIINNVQYYEKSIIHEYGVLCLKKYSNLSMLDIIKFLNIIHEVYKEINSIRENHSVDIFIENEELRFLINVNDLLKFRNYKVKVTIRSNLDIVIEKGNEKYVTNLVSEKGTILSQIY